MKGHKRNKNLWVQDLEYGTHYEGFVAGIRNIVERESHYEFVMFDRTGEICGSIPKKSADGLRDGVYSCVFNVKLEKGVKAAVVKSISKEEAYSPMDIYIGISEETRAALVHRIKAAIDEVRECEKATGGHYSALLMKYFTQAEVDLLAKRPASVADAGRYMGGALHLIANVATLCGAARHVSEGPQSAIPNGLYDIKTDFPLMLTACLLCMAGMGEYVGEDMNKTLKGTIRGYHSLLQSRIEPLFVGCGITQMEGDKLMNTLQCMFPGVGTLKSIALEASVCRGCLALYREMDQIASEISAVPTEEDMQKGYRYSEELQRPLLLDPYEEVAADVS